MDRTVTFPAPGASGTATSAPASSRQSRTDFGLKVVLPAVLGSVGGLALIVGALVWLVLNRRAKMKRADTKARRWAELKFDQDADSLSEKDIEKGARQATSQGLPTRSDSLRVSR